MSTGAHLLRARGTPEKARELRRGIHPLHRLGVGLIRYQTKGADMLQQDADHFSLCALQAASPLFMDMCETEKNAGILQAGAIYDNMNTEHSIAD